MASQAAPVLHHATTKRGVVWWYVRIPSRLSQARQARKFFRTEPEAIRFAASLARQGASLAGAFLKFSEREKAVILRCVARVGGVDNLERAADAFALRRPLGSKPLGGVMDELLQLKVQSGKRPRYIEALTSSFKRFCVRDKHSGRLTMPGYDALNDLLGAIDPAAYAQALTAFLQAHAGLLPRSLALDGKSVGNGRCGLIITLCRHEDGRPVAMTVARGKKEDSEVSEGRALLADPQVELVNALVTADPLHNKEDTVRVILEKGGDYLIGTKANTSQRLAGATQALKRTPFFN